ncbi:MAG: transketolase [Ardenticatenaceae bacterium]|nr:transketolase [Ardenticatenaceae bacterium]
MIQKDLHQLAANTIRFLAADAVQKANSGHPGMPMGMADVAVTLWTQFLKHNPADPHWPNRDRFILSGGHGSMLLYSLLHLSGYDLSLDDIKQFRQWGSLTPGHPESHLTPGVEMTTGPLGQGLSSAVGLAAAEQWLGAQFNRPDFALVDHTTYVFAGDGDMQEGVSHEACALAGHWGLGKLIVFYDDNGIQIDGSTKLAFTEDVRARFAAYGWQTQAVDGHDPTAVAAAIRTALANTDQPSLIACKTTIGYGSPNKAGTHSAHGEPLGVDEIRLAKEALGWPAETQFLVPEEAAAFLNGRSRGAQIQAEWENLLACYAETYPELAQQFKAAMAGELPAGWEAALPQFEPGSKLATRAASGKVLAGIVPVVPQLLGGSADLTGSNKTDVKGYAALQRGHFAGRYIHYGVREHGMGAIMNGLALHGGVIPYGGTFLVFSDYMRGAIRLAALMEQRVVYVFTHDSIGLGEDGPTHQPIEHLMSLRAIPNVWVFRPADANETAVAWQMALERTDGPTALALTRQNLPSLEPALADNARFGAYAIGAAADDVAAILATGSEVEIALQAQAALAAEGIRARVISMPCWELFAQQPAEYQQTVLPGSITARVSIEAGMTRGWQEHLRGGIAIGLDHFGASAPYQTLYREFGLTADAVVTAVKQQL